MNQFFRPLRALVILTFCLLPAFACAQGIDAFVGSYAGSATLEEDGKQERRDMMTTIATTKNAFVVTWTSVIFKDDGQRSEKTYTIEFVPSPRANIYGSAMKTNVFGKPEPLDPLAGEPFVWARLEGETFSVFSLAINASGEYELQEYHRTLAEGGLDLLFKRINNGAPQREIRAFLARQD